jgi:GGDEF domain-containing protein
MISKPDSLSELERCDRLRALTLNCYVAAIKNISHYAIELEDPLTGPHREYLNGLAAEVASAKPEALDESRATLRALLRAYRDKAAEYLNRLREELSNSVKALQETLNALCQSDDDHERRLREAVIRLRAIGGAPEAAAVAPMLLAAVEAIEKNLEGLREQHQLTVAQFLSEIRVLHGRIDSLEAAASVDSLTKLLRRGEMEDRIRKAPAGSFRLLLMHVNGMQVPAVAAELAGAFSKRLRNCLPADAVVGRWGESEFIAMLPIDQAETLAKAKWVAEHLSGVYACVHKGKTARPEIQVDVAAVDSEGEAVEQTLERIGTFFSRP